MEQTQSQASSSFMSDGREILEWFNKPKVKVKSTSKSTSAEGSPGGKNAMRMAREGFLEELHLAFSLSPKLKVLAHC